MPEFAPDVLVMGALHLDVIVSAPALPRLDETMMGKGVVYRLGGKGGNQAVASKRMGASAAMVGCVGTDGFAEQIRSELARSGVDTRSVLTREGASGMSVAIVGEDGGYGAVVVSGVNRLISASQASLEPPPAVVILQNEIPAEQNHALLARLRPQTLVIWNAAPASGLDKAVLDRTDILVVNRLEAAMQCGLDESLPDPCKALEILRASGAKAAIITLGAEGFIGTDADGRTFGSAGHRVEPVSTHGAGDAFVGALAARLARGEVVADGSSFAQAAAALHVACETDARQGISPDEVERFLASQPVMYGPGP